MTDNKRVSACEAKTDASPSTVTIGSMGKAGDRDMKAFDAYFSERLAKANADMRSGWSLLRAAPVDTAWEMFLLELEKKIAGTDRHIPGLQILSVPKIADWNHSRWGSYRKWLLANQLPRWGNTYQATQRSVADGYYTFITNLDIPLTDPVAQQRANDARKLLADSQIEYDDKTIDMVNAWVEFDRAQQALPSQRRKKFDDWYSIRYAEQFGLLEQRLDLLRQDYSHWFNVAHGGNAVLADVLSRWSNNDFIREIEIEDQSSAKRKLRTYTISPDLTEWIEQSKRGEGSVWSFSLSKTSYRRHTEETRMGASGFYWGGFWAVRVGGSYEKYSVDTQYDHFSIGFRAKNIGVFTIQPDQWMKPTVIQAYKNGPWVPGGPVARGTTTLFGSDGVLNLLPTTVVVAFQPEVRATLKSEDYHYAKTTYRGGGSLCIGPFGFGANYTRTVEDVAFDDETQTVTAKNTTDMPQIIAVVNSVMPDFE